MSVENVLIVNRNIFDFLFFNLCQQCTSPIKALKAFCLGFCIILCDEFFFSFILSLFRWGFVPVLGYDPQLYPGFECRKPENAVLVFCFVRFKNFVQVGSQIEITFLDHIEGCHVHWIDKRGLL